MVNFCWAALESLSLFPENLRLSEWLTAFVSRCSSQTTHCNPSYLNRLGDEPLRYLNVGQVLKITAMKYPDREAIVSCGENLRLTFSEALRRVRDETLLSSSVGINCDYLGWQTCRWVFEHRSGNWWPSCNLVTKLWILVHFNARNRSSRISLRKYRIEEYKVWKL